MLRRKRVNPDSKDAVAPGRRGRLRTALTDAGWAIREHVFWRLGDAIRHGGEVVKWPFERAAWAIRRGLLWRIEDRAVALGPVTRGVGFALVIVLAAVGGVAGLLWAAPNHSPKETTTVAAAVSTPAPVTTPKPKAQPAAKPQPTLHGAAPIFKPESEGEEPAKKKSGKHGSSSPAPASAEAAGAGQPKPLPSVLTSSGSKPAATATGSKAREGDAVAGPKAIGVARRFAAAFVLYETGRGNGEVRKAFAATAAPELRHSLLRRPPRLPANVKVPKAKVLNVVPGPAHGGVYSVSVSLLRVGLTSELRLDMEPGKGKQWRVTDILG